MRRDKTLFRFFADQETCRLYRQIDEITHQPAWESIPFLFVTNQLQIILSKTRFQIELVNLSEVHLEWTALPSPAFERTLFYQMDALERAVREDPKVVFFAEDRQKAGCMKPGRPQT